MSFGRPTALLVVAAAAAVAAATACTEDPIIGVGPDGGPGTTSPTLEFVVSAADLPSWRDTTYVGFALPGDANFLLTGRDEDLRTRALGRFAVPDTIRTFADTLPVDRFETARVVVRMDTVASVFPEFPISFRLVSLTRGFDPEEATWSLAAAGDPWDSPGGDLGATLARAELEELSDSVSLEFEVPVDSLLKAWQEADGGPGVAFLTDEDRDARVRVTQMLLRFEAVLVGREVAVSQLTVLDPRTFLYDPEQPGAGVALRVAGLPAHRFYVSFRPPDTVGEGLPFRDMIVNRAEVVFHPLSRPPGPLALERPVSGRPVRLLGDPFVLGPKTPIGQGAGAAVVFDPDSLAAGRPVEVDITSLVDAFQRDDDPEAEIRIGLRAEPDAQTLGFWEFASVEGPEDLRPRLVLILTPPPAFPVP